MDASVPQGLKPASLLSTVYGTAEAVPFQNLTFTQVAHRTGLWMEKMFDV
jgi:hypothetical protein